jgi:hypothetical protein
MIQHWSFVYGEVRLRRDQLRQVDVLSDLADVHAVRHEDPSSVDPTGDEQTGAVADHDRLNLDALGASPDTHEPEATENGVRAG